MFFNIINNLSSVGSNRGVLMAAAELHAAGQPLVLALVVHTHGSTYRKAGALALYAPEEHVKGVISGGCFESNWHKVARESLVERLPKSLMLDTQSDDDQLFGSGSGCRGTMQVLVLPVIPGADNVLYSAITQVDIRNQPLKLALTLDLEHGVTGQGWCGEDNFRFGASIESITALQHAKQGQHPVLIERGEQHLASVFTIRPSPRILLIGASVESPHLIRVAHLLGWHMTAVDHRPAQLEPIAAMADTIIKDRPTKALSSITSCFDAALIMSHSAATDLEALQVLAARNEPYIGLLGPPLRRDELLAQLTEAQRISLKPRLHAPMGLRLGGHGPEPLALSILSELQQFFSTDAG